MLRREVLSSLGLGGLMASPVLASFTKENSTNQFLVVIKLYVGNMPPKKAMAYSDKIKADLASNKPENFHFLLVPTRTEYPEISVYQLGEEQWHDSPNEEKYEEWLQLLDDDKLKEIYRSFGQGAQPRNILVGEKSYKDFTKDEVAKIFWITPENGYPDYSIGLGIAFNQYFEYAWDLGVKHKVWDARQFVIEYMQDHFGKLNPWDKEIG